MCPRVVEGVRQAVLEIACVDKERTPDGRVSKRVPKPANWLGVSGSEPVSGVNKHSELKLAFVELQ